MMYQGGKTRLAKEISRHILELAEGRTRYMEPFLGSAAVMTQVAPHFEKTLGNDIQPDIIMMWQAASVGWTPPVNLSEEEYRNLKIAEPSALRGFAGFPCSFAGKWFGGFARDPKNGHNYAKAGSKSVVNRALVMKNTKFTNLDYVQLTASVTADTVVYADPPYASTLTYKGTPDFDHIRFWNTMDFWVSKGARVIVSEYTAPEHWTCIWEKVRHTSTALDNTGATAIDRLYTLGD